MKIYRIASTSIVPEPMGTMAIPSSHIRLYHYTRGNPENVRAEGLRISEARGHTYGEPDMIWASSVPPDPSVKNIVEFHVDANDQIALEAPKGQDPQEWMKGNHHVGFYRDIRPDEIIAVHEPWHQKYRYIMKDPELVAKVKKGEFDDLTEDRFQEDFKAIQAIKRKI